MHQFFIITFFWAALIGFHAAIEQVNSYSFPKVKRIPQTFSYPSTNGNISYVDNYYWMENVNETDKDLGKFISDQNILTESFMRQCKDKKEFTKALHEANHYDDYTSFAFWGEQLDNPTYIYSLIKAGEQLPMWYAASQAELEVGKKDGMNPPAGKPFFNESLLSADQTIGITRYSMSPDGKIFGYLIKNEAYTDQGTWYWRYVNSTLLSVKSYPPGGEGRLPLTIPFSDKYAPIAWFSDGSGFFYPQRADPKGGENLQIGYKIKFHSWANADDSKDLTILASTDLGLENSDSTSIFFFLSEDDRWLFVSSYPDVDAKVRTYATFLKDKKVSEKMEWICLAPENEFQMWPVTVIDDWYYFRTDKDAINSKIVKVKLDPSKAKFVKKFNELQDRPEFIDVVQERKNALIPPAGNYAKAVAHDKVILTYAENGQNTVYLYDLQTGKEFQRILPDEKISFTYAFSYGQSTKVTYSFSSFDTPMKVYELVYEGGKINPSLISAQYIAGTKPEDFEVEQFFAKSKDGAEVPYFITSKKGTPKDGSSKVWLHAEGAYGDIDNLYYDSGYFTFLNKFSGYFVWCGPRGGGDKGGHWYAAGKGVHKQNTYDDIIACVEDLVQRKITSEGKIIVEGYNIGAMVMAAVINQARQGLIGLGLLSYGLYDIFQFESRVLGGFNNALELGNISSPNEVEAVFKWSPYQNIDPKKSYPAILALVTDATGIVPQSDSYKYLAEVQFTHENSSSPFLMYIDDQESEDQSVATNLRQFCAAELSVGAEMRKD